MFFTSGADITIKMFFTAANGVNHKYKTIRSQERFISESAVNSASRLEPKQVAHVKIRYHSTTPYIAGNAIKIHNPTK